MWKQIDAIGMDCARAFDKVSSILESDHKTMKLRDHWLIESVD